MPIPNLQSLLNPVSTIGTQAGVKGAPTPVKPQFQQDFIAKKPIDEIQAKIQEKEAQLGTSEPKQLPSSFDWSTPTPAQVQQAPIKSPFLPTESAKTEPFVSTEPTKTPEEVASIDKERVNTLLKTFYEDQDIPSEYKQVASEMAKNKVDAKTTIGYINAIYSSPEILQVKKPADTVKEVAKPGIGEQTFNTLADIGGGIVGEVPKMAADTLAFLENAYTNPVINPASLILPDSYKESMKRTADYHKQLGSDIKDWIFEKTGTNKENIGTKIGEFTGELLPFLATKNPEVFAETGTPVYNYLAKLANTTVKDATAAAQYYITSEGRLPTSKEVQDFVAMGGIFHGAVEGGKSVLNLGKKAVSKIGEIATPKEFTFNPEQAYAEVAPVISKAQEIVPKPKTLLEQGGELLKEKRIAGQQTTAGKLSTKFNRLDPTKEAQFNKMTGESTGDFLVNRGIKTTGENTVEKTAELYKSSMEEADKGFKAIKGNFNMKGEDYDYLQTAISDLKTKAQDTVNRKLEGQIKKLSEKYDNDSFTMSDMNDLKRLYQQNFKFGYLAKDITPNVVERHTNILNGIREFQFNVAKESGFDNISDINKLTQAYKFISDNLANKLNKQSMNNVMSITDYILLSGEHPAAIIGRHIGKTNWFKQLMLKAASSGVETKAPIKYAPTEEISNINAENYARNLIDNSGNNTGKSGIKLLPSGEGKTSSANVVNVNPIKMPSKIPGSDITERSKIVQPSTTAKLVDKRSGVEMQQAKGRQNAIIQKRAQELKTINSNPRGAGAIDIAQSLYLDLKQNKINYEMAEKIIENAKKSDVYENKNFQEGLDRAITRLSDEGYTFNSDGFIEKLKTTQTSKIPGTIENPLTGEQIKKPSKFKAGNIRIPGAEASKSSLIEEARKYNSAEEFANAKINAFHQSQSKVPFTEFKQKGDVGYKKAYFSQGKEGIYFSPDKEVVQAKYGKEGGVLINAMVEMKNPLDLGEFDAMYFDGRKVNIGDIVSQNFKRSMRGEPELKEPDIVLEWVSKKAKDWLQKNGYDSIKGMNAPGRSQEYVVFDKSQIKTEAQLKQIYEQAHGTNKLLKGENPIKIPGAKENVLYHGTDKQFDKFLKEKVESGDAIFLTESSENAKGFATNKLFNEIRKTNHELNTNQIYDAMKGKRNLISTIIEDNLKLFDPTKDIDVLKKHLEDKYPGLHQKYSQNGFYSKLAKGDQNNWTILEDKDMLQNIKDMGFDGYKTIEQGHKNYAIFDPKNIKIIRQELFSTLGPVVGGILLGNMLLDKNNKES